jgi:hypothetical protein
MEAYQKHHDQLTLLLASLDWSLLQLELTSNKFRYLEPVLKSIEQLSKDIGSFDQETKDFEKVTNLVDLKRRHLEEFLKNASASREKVALKMLDMVGGLVGGLARSP